MYSYYVLFRFRRFGIRRNRRTDTQMGPMRSIVTPHLQMHVGLGKLVYPIKWLANDYFDGTTISCLSSLSWWQDPSIQIPLWNIFSQHHRTAAKSTCVCFERKWLLVDEETLSFTCQAVILLLCVVTSWNNLPGGVVSAPSLNNFEGRLDKYWGQHYCSLDPNVFVRRQQWTASRSLWPT